MVKTQKTKTEPDKKQLIIMVVGIILVAVITVVVAKLIFNNSPASQSSQSTPVATESQISTISNNQSIDKDIVSKDESIQTTEQEKHITQYESEDPNQSASITGSITYSSVSGDNLIINTAIDQFLSIGECLLTLSSNNQDITKSAEIIPSPASSACDSFIIPVSELSSGDWKITINVISDDKQGIISGEVSL